MNQKIFDYAIRLLSAKPYAKQELLAKLKGRYPEDSADAVVVLSELDRLGYLDDQKYTIDFLRYHLEAKPQGKFAVTRKLLQKGIPPEMIEAALENLAPSEESMALEAATRKAALLPVTLDSQKKRERIFRFLQGRGFPHSICFDISKQVVDQDRDEYE